MCLSREHIVTFVKISVATIIGTMVGMVIGVFGYDGLTTAEIALLLITAISSVIVVMLLHKWYK